MTRNSLFLFFFMMFVWLDQVKSWYWLFEILELIYQLPDLDLEA